MAPCPTMAQPWLSPTQAEALAAWTGRAALSPATVCLVWRRRRQNHCIPHTSASHMSRVVGNRDARITLTAPAGLSRTWEQPYRRYALVSWACPHRPCQLSCVPAAATPGATPATRLSSLLSSREATANSPLPRPGRQPRASARCPHRLFCPLCCSCGGGEGCGEQGYGGEGYGSDWPPAAPLPPHVVFVLSPPAPPVPPATHQHHRRHHPPSAPDTSVVRRLHWKGWARETCPPQV